MLSPTLYRYLPVGLCLAVALMQMILSHTHHLSPWRGGGFGMYATIDDVYRRRLLIEGIDAKDRFCTIQVPLRNPKIRSRVLLLPDEGLLKRVASELLEESFIPTQRAARELKPGIKGLDLSEGTQLTYRMVEPGEAISRKSIKLKSVRVSVWRPKYNPDSMKYFWHPVTPTIEVEAP